MFEGISEEEVEVYHTKTGGKNIPENNTLMHKCPPAEEGMGSRSSLELGQCGRCGKSKENCER